MRRLVGAGRGGTPRRQASAETVFGAQNLGEIARQLAGWRRHGGGWRLVIAIPLRQESLSREPVGVEPEPWFSLPRAGFGERSRLGRFKPMSEPTREHAIAVFAVSASFFVAYVTMFARARRRYGGYVVHLGILLLYMGFLGAAYDVEREGQLEPGESLEVSGVTVRYDGYREERDVNREMLFADMTVSSGGREVGHVAPAKFVYATHPDMPTTEVSIQSSPLADLYVILSTIDPATSNGTFRVIHRPLVFWIWFGGFVVLLGTFLSAFPSVREILGDTSEDRVPSRGLAAAAATLLVVLGLAAGIGVVAVAMGLFSPSPAHAQSDSSSTLHAGTVEIHDPMERQIFERLLCQCGDCARLPLSTCGCGWAENMRAEVRDQIARDMDVAAIQADYRERFGPAALAVPSDSGLDRALWAVPVAAIVIALPALFFAVRRLGKRAAAAPEPATSGDAPSRPELDARLEEELRNLDE